jgi:hypothetical protein
VPGDPLGQRRDVLAFPELLLGELADVHRT